MIHLYQETGQVGIQEENGTYLKQKCILEHIAGPKRKNILIFLNFQDSKGMRTLVEQHVNIL